MGFAAASVVQSNLVILVALTCTAVGALAVLPPLNGLLKSHLNGPAVACGVAVYNSIGSLGGILGPYLIGVTKGATGTYTSSMMVFGLGLMISAVVVFVLGRAMEPRMAVAAATRADA
jgi:MFS transporter, ACS family, tartrate transporter